MTTYVIEIPTDYPVSEETRQQIIAVAKKELENCRPPIPINERLEKLEQQMKGIHLSFSLVSTAVGHNHDTVTEILSLLEKNLNNLISSMCTVENRINSNKEIESDHLKYNLTQRDQLFQGYRELKETIEQLKEDIIKQFADVKTDIQRLDDECILVEENGESEEDVDVEEDSDSDDEKKPLKRPLPVKIHNALLEASKKYASKRNVSDTFYTKGESSYSQPIPTICDICYKTKTPLRSVINKYMCTDCYDSLITRQNQPSISLSGFTGSSTVPTPSSSPSVVPYEKTRTIATRTTGDCAVGDYISKEDFHYFFGRELTLKNFDAVLPLQDMPIDDPVQKERFRNNYVQSCWNGFQANTHLFSVKLDFSRFE